MHISFHRVKRVTVTPTHTYTSSGRLVDSIDIIIETEDDGRQKIDLYSSEQLETERVVIEAQPRAEAVAA